MTVQTLTMTGAGGLAEVLPPGVVMAVACLASLVATLAWWRTLAAS
jgi:hypothetical protein